MKRSEILARCLVIIATLSVLVIPPAVHWFNNRQAVELHARIAETGGWTPESISAQVGAPLHLRLTSDDVIHGFAVGKLDGPAVDVEPGKVTSLTLNFDKPGKYTFYCTRWCGLNHWRMRGTIDVTGKGTLDLQPAPAPLYMALYLDLDAPHPAAVIPVVKPSAVRGKELADAHLISRYLITDYYRSHSPAQVYLDLRADPSLTTLKDPQVWDLVAYIWQQNTTPAELAAGRQRFARNCAACHGETAAGNGVFADDLAQFDTLGTNDRNRPVDFTNPITMLGASPALLQGKIIRGGMGTGMPMWGSIFSDDQIWSVISYLYSYHFEESIK